MKENILEKYAEMIVETGANVQKGQMVAVTGSVEAAPLIRAVVKHAYSVGASKVKVKWHDDFISRTSYEYQTIDTLSELKEYRIAESLDEVESGCCYIHIESNDPDAFAGIDAEKLMAPRKAMYAHKDFPRIMNYTMNNEAQWTIAAYPGQAWAEKVFPNEKPAKALKLLEEAILKASRVTSRNNPIKEWSKHNYRMHKNARTMNKYNFAKLHYSNSLGTDLTIELPNNHIWIGGSEKDANNVEFNANIPTEEVFSAPKATGVNGRVYATKPLVFQGTVIDGFYLDFKDGRIVSYHADKNEEALKSLIETDEGSHYLGEVALVPFDSPINETGILFFNTLFDENASCHLAIGRAYPMCVKRGTKMNEEQQKEAGLNSSNTHNDFMVGSRDLKIIGTTFDGEEVVVFENGNFAF